MFLAQIERYLSGLGSVAAQPVVERVEHVTAAIPSLPDEPPKRQPRPPRVPKLRPDVPYAHPLLRRYGAFYKRVQEQMADNATDIKKVTAPVPTSVYDEMMSYLTKHKDETGYPQSIREFVTLAIRNLTVDLSADAVEGESNQECVGTNVA